MALPMMVLVAMMSMMATMEARRQVLVLVIEKEPDPVPELCTCGIGMDQFD